MLLDLLRWTLLAAGLLMAAGTLVNLSHSAHWAVRIWDFPRVQILAVAAAAGIAYLALFFGGSPLESAYLLAVALACAYQLRRIIAYTPLHRLQVQRSRAPREGGSLRLLISNVLMENREHGRLVEAVRRERPDVVLALEVDEAWRAALEPLHRDYPHRVVHPQQNYYGLVLLSRFPLRDPRVEFLVQDDIPSVHAVVELPSGEEVVLHGLHPRPPEPVRDQDSTPRDAELVLMGRAIGEAEPRPTVVAGDLNDVAWSRTTELFLRLSGLLDPRVGRGFFSSYNADSHILRYPLDHVFHSNHFRLVELRRLPSIGSDHFPMLIELSLEADAPGAQPRNEREPGDEEQAEEELEEQAEAAATGEDRPNEG